MTTLFTWLTGFLTFTIATIDTVDITLGVVLAYMLIAGVALGVYRKAKGRA